MEAPEIIDGPKTVSEICEYIRRSGNIVLESGDYLSFSTLLDMVIGDPSKFNEAEAREILETLRQLFEASEVLIFNVGWDLPEILLRYIDRFYRDDKAFVECEPFRHIMSLFALLSEHGNPQELFLKSAELIDNLSTAGWEMPKPGTDRDSRHENLKFVSLVELMSYTLRRIDTMRPSRLFIEAAAVLLKVPTSPNIDILTVIMCLRRVYLFARDFRTKGIENVDPEELQQLRTVMQNFLTYAVELSLSRFSAHWAERLYVQLKTHVALAPATSRCQGYEESMATKQLTEALYRICQLLLTYDFDPVEVGSQLLRKATNNFEEPFDILGSPALTPRDSPSPYPHSEPGTPSTADVDTKDTGMLSEPSVMGTLLLSTELHFSGQRQKVASFPHCISACLSLATCPSAGSIDAVIYWSLWNSSYITSETLRDTDVEAVNSFLSALMLIAKRSQSDCQRLVVHSVILRVLRHQAAEPAVDYLLTQISDHSLRDDDTVETAAKMLKALVSGKLRPHGDSTSAQAKEFPPITISEAQKQRLVKIVATAIESFLSQDQNTVPLITLLTLVKIDATVADQIANEVQRWIDNRSQEDNLTRITIMAVDSLRTSHGLK